MRSQCSMSLLTNFRHLVIKAEIGLVVQQCEAAINLCFDGFLCILGIHSKIGSCFFFSSIFSFTSIYVYLYIYTYIHRYMYKNIYICLYIYIYLYIYHRLTGPLGVWVGPPPLPQSVRGGGRHP